MGMTVYIKKSFTCLALKKPSETDEPEAVYTGRSVYETRRFHVMQYMLFARADLTPCPVHLGPGEQLSHKLLQTADT